MGGDDRKKKKKLKINKECSVEKKPAAGGRRSTQRCIDLKSGRRVAGLSEGDRHATQHLSGVCNLLWSPLASVTGFDRSLFGRM